MTKKTGHQSRFNIGPLSVRWNSLAYYYRGAPDGYRPHLIDYYWNERWFLVSARRYIAFAFRGKKVLVGFNVPNQLCGIKIL